MSFEFYLTILLFYGKYFYFFYANCVYNQLIIQEDGAV